MSKTVNLTTRASDVADDFTIIINFSHETDDDDTLAKRLRFEETGNVNGDDESSKQISRFYRLQASALPGDGVADGESGTPAPFTKGTGAVRTALGNAIKLLFKQWREDVNNDVEA